MNNEQLQAVLSQVEKKRAYLQTKIIPNQPIPKWLQMELDFVADHEAIAKGFYEVKEREGKKDELIKRLTGLIGLFEDAFTQLMKNRPALVHWTGKVEYVNAGNLIFFHLARLMPPGLNKLHTLQFYHEYTSSLFTGRETGTRNGTAQTNSSNPGKTAVP